MKVRHVTEESAAAGRTGEYRGSSDMTPPRSLGRYAPAVRLRRALPALTQQAHDESTDSGEKAPRNMCARREKGRAPALFP